ncbi:MAG: hypothetical protein DMG05_21005 [Acidobacteria bacterium]|nr:MAG: hypothetical protein DMG05_21005 [Acidobacteriota bacterium]
MFLWWREFKPGVRKTVELIAGTAKNAKGAKDRNVAVDPNLRISYIQISRRFCSPWWFQRSLAAAFLAVPFRRLCWAEFACV